MCAEGSAGPGTVDAEEERMRVDMEAAKKAYHDAFVQLKQLKGRAGGSENSGETVCGGVCLRARVSSGD